MSEYGKPELDEFERSGLSWDLTRRPPFWFCTCAGLEKKFKRKSDREERNSRGTGEAVFKI